ncbi:MAG: DUF547 domain-containing protein [Desulfobacterales bacterium]|nr:DUF547 domain-containing protein [Desulfobacterales bacterium]
MPLINQNGHLKWAALILLVMVSTISTGWASTPVDHSMFKKLLMKYVKHGVVDYQGFKNEEARLDQYLLVLENTDSNALDRNEQFAFFINAYNAWTIKLILSKYPGIKSIKDIGGLFQKPWSIKIARIDGQLITLDYIEHEILRPRFKDPRVHFAINCAARSCPPLQSEPFTGAELETQLDQATEAFINDPASNRLEGQTLHVSKIFKWFKEDFNDDIVGFFLKNGNEGLVKGIESSQQKIKIEYLHYDWSLNGP